MPELTADKTASARRYNERQSINAATWDHIKSTLPFEGDVDSDSFVVASAVWQDRMDLDPDGKWGTGSLSQMRRVWSRAQRAHKPYELDETAYAASITHKLLSSEARVAVKKNRDTVATIDAKHIQDALDLSVDGVIGPTTVNSIAGWQAAQGHDPNGVVGAFTLGGLRSLSGLVTTEEDFSSAACKIVMEFTKKFEARKGSVYTVYSSANTDGEWEGAFDRPKRDANGRRIPTHRRRKEPNFRPFWASRYSRDGGRHIGLSFGPWQATQDGGELGKVVEELYNADPKLLAQIFGGKGRIERLIRMLRSATGSYHSARSARTQILDGHDVWEKHWLRPLQETMQHEVFREALRRRTAKAYLVPMIVQALKDGFHDQGALAVYFDIAIQFGPRGARKKIKKGLGPDLYKSMECQPADIEKVIDALPKGRQDRRTNILRAADQFTSYSADSLRAFAENPNGTS